MSHERPDFTKEFLASNPQVAYALFQAMIMMNIVDPNTITRIMSEQPIVQATAPVQPVVVTPQMPVMQAPQPIRQPPPVVPQQQPMMNNPLPTPNQMSPQLPEDGPEQQKALLMRVLQLTDEQINALPPQARDQIRILVRNVKVLLFQSVSVLIELYFIIEKPIDNTTTIIAYHNNNERCNNNNLIS